MIGKIIKNLREQKGITQIQLAKILHIQNSTLSQYENGMRNPSDEIKHAIANYFNVTLDYLLGRTDVPNQNNISVPNNLKDIPIAFSDGLKDLSKEDLDEVSKFVDFLKSKKK